MEAVRAGQADTLYRLHRELAQSGCARVFDGTKNGRPREVHPADIGRALAAVQRALEILETSGTRFLVTQVNGAETTGLKQAANIYRNILQPRRASEPRHPLCLSEERIQAYRSDGYSVREARVATSLDLGHGDGRGRYVASVYVRSG
jgi:hypothetical protein